MKNEGVIKEDGFLSLNKSKRKKIFLRSYKSVLLDLGIYFTVNAVIIYMVMFFIPDTAIAMVAIIWVGIISWRGGIIAGVIACFVLLISTGISVHLPPHNLIEESYYFAGNVPSYLMGAMQWLLCGLIVGYISTLFHKLRSEIILRKEVQSSLEQRVAELNVFGKTVAHDLKNPLTVINVSINALLKEFSKSDNTIAIKRLTFINDSTKHMVNIIESILILAGIKNIDETQYILFPMSQCIEDAIDRLSHNIESNNVQIIKGKNWPKIIGYAPWITEVWVNYMTNAIKYGINPENANGKKIELGYDMPGSYLPSVPGHIRFWVKDHGQGIEKEKMGVLFQEFTRLHSTEREGHGLGLSIVKNVVDKCGGTIGVESEIGEGSLFYFTLPAPAALK